ncbi:MAG: nitroreductase family deazaflavin-dependent oxidoreductase [Acidimicrobiia bacterium]|nr:nitroreductase family deazaflavin-dependent oxidoreductase [Acidimicrobiia bacterium]
MPSHDAVELTVENLGKLTDDVRSASGPGATTRSFNETLIAEFRANGGQLAGDLARARFLLLTTTGARTGRQRTCPLAYHKVDDRLLVIASKGGAPTGPAWYANLVAHPEVTVELGAETFSAKAAVLEGEERARMFEHVATRVSQFADYQRRTSRVIPVVELLRKD